jgi:hypothetical protein
MIVGIDAGIDAYGAADLLARQLPERLAAAGDLTGIHTATHTVQVGDPRFAVTVFWQDVSPPADALWAAVTAALPDAGLVMTAPDAEDARTSGPELAVLGAWVAVTRIARGASGRVVVWPGAAALDGPLTVGQALAQGHIAAVEVVGGAPAGPDEIVDPLGFVRPRWRPAGCVLQVQRGPDGLLVPFERETLTR